MTWVGIVAPTCKISALGGHRQEDYHRFQASLVNIVNSLSQKKRKEEKGEGRGGKEEEEKEQEEEKREREEEEEEEAGKGG